MALWILLLIAIIIVFVAVHAVLLPKLFLKVKYDYEKLPDRGVKTVDDINGRSIVYSPEQSVKKYMRQYIVSERDGKKTFVAKIEDEIRFIDFDIVLFDDKGNSFKVLNVKELIKTKGYTQYVELSEKTAYVTVVLNKVNDLQLPRASAKNVVSKGVALYILFCSVVEILGVFGVKACIGKIYGGLYFESFLYIGNTWIFTGVLCAAAIVLNVICTVLVVYAKRGKKVREGADA